MGRMKDLHIQIQELGLGIELMRLEDTTEELQTLNFDTQNHTDDSEWWREQDSELAREELEAIEIQADVEDLRRWAE